MLNHFVGIGKLITEVTLDKANDKYVANYMICSFRQTKGQGDLLPCVVWNKRALAASQYLHKGSLVGVAGRLETEYTVDKRSGYKTLNFKLVVTDQQFLDNRQTNYQTDEEKHYE